MYPTMEFVATDRVYAKRFSNHLKIKGLKSFLIWKVDYFTYFVGFEVVLQKEMVEYRMKFLHDILECCQLVTFSRVCQLFSALQ